MAETKIAIVQCAFVDAHVDHNLTKLTQILDRLDHGTRIVIFPELYLHGFVDKHEVAELAEHVDGPSLNFVKRLATSRGVVIVVGFAEALGGRFYNSVAWVPPSGAICVYRKNHLWLCDEGVFDSGDDIVVIDYDGFTFGLAICFDVEFPETGRALALNGANVFVIVNGNMAPFGRVHRLVAQTRALENHAYVVMCNRVGDSRGRSFIGESMVVEPSGDIVHELHDGEHVGYAVLRSDPIDRSKTNYSYLDHIARRSRGARKSCVSSCSDDEKRISSHGAKSQ